MADKLTARLAELATHASDFSVPNGTETEFTEKEERQIVRKIDLRLVTLVGFMYCVSLIDRTNLSNANIAGMSEDLDLAVGFRYNIVSLVFFPTYVVFQIPSTVIVRKIGPRIHLGTLTLVWGAVMIGMGFVQTWTSLAGLRVILGVLEAGFFPSCVYLLSTWYSRYDMGVRYSMFYILGSVAAAFSSILAYGVMQLKGRANLNGWRWIFIVEGILTCAIAFVGYVFLIGFPDSTKPSRWLNEKQIQWVIQRVEKDRGDAHVEPFKLGKYLRSGLDLKIWAFAMIFFNTTTITYGLAYFLPVILKDQLHFSVGLSQILVAPPAVLAGIVTYITGWVGDNWRIRGPIVVFNMILALVGTFILGWASAPGVKYFGIFLMSAGSNSNVPATMTYQANNIRGQWKRAFCSATMVGFGGIGGVAGSLVFRSQDAPTYRPGLYACIACAGLNIILVAMLTVKFKSDNKKADEGNLIIEGSEEGFRYTY